MRTMIVIMVLICFFKINGFASDYTTYVHSLYEKTDDRWTAFQLKADRFLDELAQGVDQDHKEGFEKILQEKQVSDTAEFKKAFLDAQEQFLILREKLAKLLFLNGTGSYAECSSVTAVWDITEWYTSYLEKKVFQTMSQVSCSNQ